MTQVFEPETPGSRDDRLHCPVATRCGGCAWIDLPYVEQLERKTQRVRDALDGEGFDTVHLEPCRPAPRRSAYRNRGKLAVGRRREGLRIGLFGRGGHDLVDLAPCRVQGSAIQRRLEALRTWLTRHRLAAPEGPVFYVDLRETAGPAIHVTLVVEAGSPAWRDPEAHLRLDSLLLDVPDVCGVAVNAGNPRSSFPLGDETRGVRGPEWFAAPVPREHGGEDGFLVPPTGFFQVSADALDEVHRRMAGFLRAESGSRGLHTLYDLYCGVGVHGISLAVILGCEFTAGIESSSRLVEAARANARRFRIDAEFHEGKVEDRLPAALARRPADAIVMNPGRSGCAAGALDALDGSSAAAIAYLSCDPRTLARDLRRLVDTGHWCIDRAVAFDLMPQTDQVETLALLGQPRAASRTRSSASSS